MWFGCSSIGRVWIFSTHFSTVSNGQTVNDFNLKPTGNVSVSQKLSFLLITVFNFFYFSNFFFLSFFNVYKWTRNEHIHTWTYLIILFSNCLACRHLRMHAKQKQWLQLGKMPKHCSIEDFCRMTSKQMPQTFSLERAIAKESSMSRSCCWMQSCVCFFRSSWLNGWRAGRVHKSQTSPCK